MNLIERINYFYKLANDINEASYAVEKLKSDKFFNADLWFTKYPAISNLDKSFGIIDKKISEKVKKQGIRYLDSPEYNDLRNFIIDSFDQDFKRFKLKSYKVVELLEDQGSEDLFLLIHDLIHQVFEFFFKESIESQIYDKSEDPGYFIPIMDRLNEDAASSLSNFQPKKSIQGIFTYLEDLFEIYSSEYEPSEENLRNLINKVFETAKSDLRKNGNAKFKQFADGFLSKLKGEMIDKQNIKWVLNSTSKDHDLSNVWKLYDLQEQFENEYYERLDNHDLLNEEDAIVLRNWLMKCIKKANEVLNKDYWENDEDEEI